MQKYYKILVYEKILKSQSDELKWQSDGSPLKPNMDKKKMDLLTFGGIFKPFHKFLHLFQENTLSFGRVSIFVPFQNYFFTNYISCSNIKITLSVYAK